MTEKYGTRRQRLATEFDKTPASATSLCPFKGPDIAIVPVRYALDRSRYDVNPAALKPLPKNGRWASLPILHSRQYTLRQLADGFVYVFDETAGTFHEYSYSAQDAGLARIVWTQAHLGQDERSGTGEASPFLLYPRRHVLHIAYAPVQWTWRLCEHMRSHAGSRAIWMKRLDLARYCQTLNEPHTLPLRELAQAVADIDAGSVKEDQRFDDTSLPSSEPPHHPEESGKPAWVPLAADVHWLGSVPDKDSALLIALDDPLAVARDLAAQMAAEIAEYQMWETEHAHRITIAGYVTELCGADPGFEGDKLPEKAKGDLRLTHEYLRDAEAYLAEREKEDDARNESKTVGGGLAATGIHLPSDDAHKEVLARYGRAHDEPDVEAWLKRKKWRKEVDLEAARHFLLNQLPRQQRLLQRIGDTREDVKRWHSHIGTEPLALFIDTLNPTTLMYLASTFAELQAICAQDEETAKWLQQQEHRATTLFGLHSYGFSLTVKEALDSEANRLLQGFGDLTSLATRAGELNNAFNHRDFADVPWVKALHDIPRRTLEAMVVLGKRTTGQFMQSMLQTSLATQGTSALHDTKNMSALLRHLLLNQILDPASAQLAIDRDIATKLKEWKHRQRSLTQQLQALKNRWHYTVNRQERHNLGRQISGHTTQLRIHEMNIPFTVDYRDQRYAEQYRKQIIDFTRQAEQSLDKWAQRTRQWVGHLNLTAGIGWTVVVINLINVFVVLNDAGSDGEISQSDLIKIGYNLGYGLNLWAAIYVATPWQIVRKASLVTGEGQTISALSRSADFWKKQGRPEWAAAVKSFRLRLFISGAFGAAAAALEMKEILNDISNAKKSTEKNLLKIKLLTVAVMGALASLQGITMLLRGAIGASAGLMAMGGMMTIYLLTTGLIYLTINMIINHLKQDNIGNWLRRCYWSYESENRFGDSLIEQQEEARSLEEALLCPQILVKLTFDEVTSTQHGRIDLVEADQNGAWIQILLPTGLRSHMVPIHTISTMNRYWVAYLQKIDDLTDTVIADGSCQPLSAWQKVDNRRPPINQPSQTPLPLEDGAPVIWQVWVPLHPGAEYIEFQIWYPESVLRSNNEDNGYLFQVSLEPYAKDTNKGLEKTNLLVRQKNRPSEDKSILLR